MTTIMEKVLSAQITPIPNSLEKLLGNGNFNNYLCNAVTWMVAIWFVVHKCHKKLINAYLKQRGFAEYLRVRLSDSVWLFTFFVIFFLYYLASIHDYNASDLMNIKRSIIEAKNVENNGKNLVYTILCSFYIYMGLDEGLSGGSLHSSVKYFSLTVVCVTAYMLRILDVPFTLTALTSVSGMAEELCKILDSILNKNSELSNLFVSSVFLSSAVIFGAIHFIVIPFSYLIPLGVTLLSGHFDWRIILLFAFMLCWLNLVIYKSLILNFVLHWAYHVKRNDLKQQEKEELEYEEESNIKLNCLGSALECSLFPPRTDEGFMISFLRAETKRRQKRMIAKRKPKNRNMIIQTLKCMMVIKKKLSQKHSEDSSESENEEAEQNLLTSEGEAENNSELKRSDKKFSFVEENNEFTSQNKVDSEEIVPLLETEVRNYELESKSEENVIDANPEQPLEN